MRLLFLMAFQYTHILCRVSERGSQDRVPKLTGRFWLSSWTPKSSSLPRRRASDRSGARSAQVWAASNLPPFFCLEKIQAKTLLKLRSSGFPLWFCTFVVRPRPTKACGRWIRGQLNIFILRSGPPGRRCARSRAAVEAGQAHDRLSSLSQIDAQLLQLFGVVAPQQQVPLFAALGNVALLAADLRAARRGPPCPPPSARRSSRAQSPDAPRWLSLFFSRSSRFLRSISTSLCEMSLILSRESFMASPVSRPRGLGRPSAAGSACS